MHKAKTAAEIATKDVHRSLAICRRVGSSGFNDKDALSDDFLGGLEYDGLEYDLAPLDLRDPFSGVDSFEQTSRSFNHHNNVASR